MRETITPRVDIAFKKIFGVDENKDLLMSLINSIVSAEDQVAVVTILNPYNPRNFKNDKLSILDIKAEGHSGKFYNIEIQISDEADYDKRALYYWAKLYTQQLKITEDYSVLNKAIGIHILNFTSIPNVEKYHNVFHLLEKESKVHYFRDIELHTIELNKFKNDKAGQKLDKAEELKLLLPKIKTSLDRWVTFLTRYDLLEAKQLPNELKDSKLEKALDVLEEMNFTEQEREAYEDHLKWLRIEANTLKKAENKGFTEGVKKVAISMLVEGQSIAFISKMTGLSEAEIKNLQSSQEIDKNSQHKPH